MHTKFGGYYTEVTPVPIPNTEVKLCSAYDTWREAARESWSLPEQRKGHPEGCPFSVKSILRIGEIVNDEIAFGDEICPADKFR